MLVCGVERKQHCAVVAKHCRFRVCADIRGDSEGLCSDAILWDPAILTLSLSLYLSIYRPVCLSVCLSMDPSIYLSIHLSVRAYLCVCIYIHIYMYINTCTDVTKNVCPCFR